MRYLNVLKRVVRFGWRFLVWGFAGFGFLVALLIAVLGAQVSKFMEPDIRLNREMVLTLDIRDFVLSDSLLFPASGRGSALTPLNLHILAERAAKDERVRALAVRVSSQDLPFFILPGHAQQIAASLRNFRTSGKPVWVFSEQLNGRSLLPLLLATSGDRRWIAPSAFVDLTGMRIERFYFAEALEKLGVRADFERREEYKSGSEPFTRSRMSQSVRENLQKMLDGLYAQTQSQSARQAGIAAVRLALLAEEHGIITPIQAKQAGIFTDIGHKTDFDKALTELWPEARRIAALDYLRRSPKPEGPEIAVLHAVGAIAASQSGGGQQIAADSVLRHIERLRERENVAALLLYLDSPGGGYDSSLAIWRALRKWRMDTGKPVIVLMGGTAASGGYMIASAAERIFAQPATITGSIGVFGGKIANNGLLEKLGVQAESLTSGPHTGLWSFSAPLTSAERAIRARAFDAIYDNFLSIVSESRNLPENRLRLLAGGRIWLGSEAVQNGLVDSAGGFAQAIEYLRERLGPDFIKQDDDFSFIELRPDWREQLGNFRQFLVQARAVLRVFSRQQILEIAPFTLHPSLGDMNFGSKDELGR